MTKIMHDQEIMSILLEQFGEDAAEQFGDCLLIFNNPSDPQDCPHELLRKMLNTVNQTLEDIGSQMRVHTIQDCDNDGYFWEVSE